MRRAVAAISVARALSLMWLAVSYPCRLHASAVAGDPLVVSPDELAGMIREEKALVADARARTAYRAGHLPGALSLPADEMIFDAAPPPQLGTLGDPVRTVVYGDSSDYGPPALLLWLFEWAGFPSVAALDGGFQAWLAAGRPVEATDRSAPATQGTYVGDPKRYACADQIRDVFGRPLGRPAVEILDVRGSRVWGATEAALASISNVRTAGHIPHSLPLDWRDYLRPDGCLKDPVSIAERIDGIGPRPETSVRLDSKFVVYGDGRSQDAAIGYLLLRIAGVPEVACYAGGWSDWTSDPSRPTVVVLDAADVNGLIADRSRGTNVLIDVRERSDFEKGHIPGAIALAPYHFADSLDVALARHLGALASPASTRVVTYCYGPECVRSRNCATLAARAGFARVGWFRGGIEEWLRMGRGTDTGVCEEERAPAPMRTAR
jgi:thiosulfate/3-mercaptopyruvate sulfurtransferase